MKLEERLERWKNLALEARVPGVAIAVVDQEVVHSAAFGMAKTNMPVRTNTVFEADSRGFNR